MRANGNISSRCDHAYSRMELTYKLVAGEGGRSANGNASSWHPDTSKIETAPTEQERKVARLTASVVATAMKTMEGKTVMWQRVPPSEMLSPAK